jgi:RNA polymerase sigma factor (TIGR02999 family)
MSEELDITGLLRVWREGEIAAGEKLAPLVYDDLYERAAAIFHGEAEGHTLQPTALVHEAFARLVKVDVEWQSRAHFFALSARMMRRLLINHANSRRAVRRGGGAVHLPLQDELHADDVETRGLVELMDALQALEELDPRKASLIEMQYFGGMSHAEMAEVAGLSVATVGRELRFARAWLRKEMAGGE